MKDAVINYTDTTSPEAVDRYVRKWRRSGRMDGKDGADM